MNYHQIKSIKFIIASILIFTSIVAKASPPVIVSSKHNLLAKVIEGKQQDKWVFQPKSAWNLKYIKQNTSDLFELSVDTLSKSFRVRHASASLDVSKVISKAGGRIFRFGGWVKVDAKHYRRGEIFTIGLYGDYGFSRELREFRQDNLWTYLEGRVIIPNYVKNIKLKLILWTRQGKACIRDLYVIPDNLTKPVWKCGLHKKDSKLKWQLKDRKFRITGSIDDKSGNQPLWIDFDFARLLLMAGTRNPIDPSSIKVLVIKGNNVLDIPAAFENPLSTLEDHYKRNGTLKWRTVAGCKHYEIYFNVSGNEGARPLVLKQPLGIGELISYPIGIQSPLWAGWPGIGLEVKDVDSDGDYDIYAKSNDSDIWLLRNIGTNSSPVFLPRLKPLEDDLPPLIPSSALSVDWDNDGDLDIISYKKHRRGKYIHGVWASIQIQFNENGNFSKPVDIVDMQNKKVIFDNACWFAFDRGDFDGDGLQDLVVGTADSSLYLLMNRQNRNRVEKVVVPWNIYKQRYDSGDMSLKPYVIDWNKDKRDDIVLTGWTGYVGLMLNRNIPQKADWRQAITLREINGLLSVADSPTPAAVDWNGDGLTDLICGDVCGHLTYFENKGTDESPSFACGVRLCNDQNEPIRITASEAGATIQGPSERWWGYLSCQATDVDRDNDFDLIINDSLGRLRWIENVGSKKSPVLSHVIRPFIDEAHGLPVITPWRNRPGVADINRDGTTEIVILNKEGALVRYSISPEHPDYLTNYRILKGADGKAVVVNSSKFSHPGSGRTQLEVADWDDDGDVDILIGRPRDRTGGGNILLFENVGSQKKMILKKGYLLARGLRFVEWTGSDGHDQWHSGAPCMVDLDKNGSMDLIHGVESGRFAFYSHDFFVGDSFPVFSPESFEMLQGNNAAVMFDFKNNKQQWYNSLIPHSHPLQWLEKDLKSATNETRSIKIILPAKNVAISGKIVFEASVSGGSVVCVEFYVDGKLLAKERSAPFVALGDDNKWDTRQVSNGFHELSVKAIYSDGKTMKVKQLNFVRN